MAFGITRQELTNWKKDVIQGEIAFLTHYWLDDRFPDSHCVTKVGCANVEKLAKWGSQFGLKKEWIHHYDLFPHFDLLGEKQFLILKHYGLEDHIKKFKLKI
ncbi:hypothetical protein FS935_05140 [Metabacillus litoralis]|uniref:YneQ n=1 Tax=Metabacillus litoralis TaxID=152268 RepID=A0A5C6W1M2_9BACI|nr:hypothetical protein [Metabacillus litoralis]TXC91773.1 hypothetical protein FS935_05140 [Metabacillus litoralis]